MRVATKGTVSSEYTLGDLIDDLRGYAGARTTVIAYAANQDVSQTEPLVVYVDGENVYG